MHGFSVPAYELCTAIMRLLAAHQAPSRAGRAPALGRGQSALRRYFSGLLGFAELYGFPKNCLSVAVKKRFSINR